MSRVQLDLTKFERHNVVADARGLRTRKTLVELHTPTAGCEFVGGFSVESPSTSDVWHYLFERDTTAGTTTLRVTTEEYSELFSFYLGAIGSDPVVTHGVQSAQLMVGSSSFSAPLYGVCGGGIVTATKTESTNPDTTALEIPTGALCVFGDRYCVAQGQDAFFDDPGTDPRTFVAENVVALPGSIYDHFQGPDGALWFFTSAGVWTLSSDALGQGQEVVGFLSKVPGVDVSRARNACATNGAVAVLQKDHVVLLPASTPIDLASYSGRRYYSRVVEVDDLRLAAELFPTQKGFLVGFRARRGHYVDVDLKAQSVTHVWNPNSALNVVGTLRSRENETLVVLKDRVVSACGTGPTDFDGSTVQGVLCGRVPLPVGDRPVLRRLTVGSDAYGATVAAFVSGTAKYSTTPTKASDALIGTATWSSSAAVAGREVRTVRHSFDVRDGEPCVELLVEGGDVRIAPVADVEVNGQGRARRDSDG